MAIELSRIDRKARTYALTDVLTGAVPAGVTGVDVALLPPRSAPTAATVWTAATYASGSFTVLLAGPDASSTGALVVPASADLWMRITNAPEVDAEKVERVTILGGGAVLATPTGVPVVSVNGKTGAAVVVTATDIVGALRPSANSIALIGDSRQAQNGGYPIGPDSPGFAAYDDRGVWTWLIPMLGQRLKIVGNWAVGGLTTAQVLAAIGPPLAAHPGYVADNSGINDLLTTVPLATIKANKTAIVNAILAAGATPILETIFASSSLNTTAKQTDRHRLNNWLRAYAQNNPGVILLDHERAVTDPATGNPLAGTTWDGLHQTQKGATLMAAAAAPILAARIQPTHTLASTNANDPDNLLANPVMLPIGSAFPSSWFAVVGGSDITSPTILAHPDQPSVGFFQCVVPPTKYLIMQGTVPDAAVIQGRPMVFQIEVEGGTDWTGVTEMGARLWYLNSSSVQMTNATSHFHRTGFEDSAAPGAGSAAPRNERQILRTPALVPPVGATKVQPQFFFGGGGTIRIGRASVRYDDI
jgi:lysophospholipase L1-like esterase